MRMVKFVFIFLLLTIFQTCYFTIDNTVHDSMKPIFAKDFTVVSSIKLPSMNKSCSLNKNTVVLTSLNTNFEDMNENSDISTALGWTVNSMEENNSTSKVTIFYPKTNNATIDDFIRTNINNLEQEFNSNITKIKSNPSNKNKDTLGKLIVKYQVYALDKNLVSIVFNINKYYINENSTQTYLTYTFDLSQNKQVYLKDIFLDPNYLNVLSETSLNKLKNSEIKDLLKSDGLEVKEENFSQWALSEKDLVLYFNKNQITPSIHGTYKIKIPYDELKDKLTFLKEAELKSNPEPNTTSTPEGDLKYVALTFDDGPSQYTSALLDVLGKYNAKATFFLVGNRISNDSNVVKRIYDSGQQIGNHSYDHVNLTKIETQELESEVRQTADLIGNITGAHPIVIRPPYGDHNQITDDMCSLYGCSIILWNLDSLDWEHRDVGTIYSNVVSNVKDGDIVLMHDLYPTTVDAVTKILEDLSGKGYKFVTVSELAAIKNKQLESGKTYTKID